jgi:ppGpp synthetase/RelA/SpoT-type nucleotidyltranferase
MAQVIDAFMKSWPREIHFWSNLAEAALDVCKDGVQDKLKLKCNMSCRAKSQASLRGSIERRQLARGTEYTTREEIEEDMIDLAGVRITLAFPNDVEEVKQFLIAQFGDVEQRFWGLDENGNAVERTEKGRFIGYRATHFLVKWKQLESGSRWYITEEHVGRTVEIQVTSILMNAWQEAHHDLVYKQLNGVPSDDEKSLIDMINGIAHAGEMALVQLQKILKRRVETLSREFADEYEVGTWLKTHLPELLGVKKLDYIPMLQRLETLFDVLRIFGVTTPSKLEKDLLEKTHAKGLHPGAEVLREFEKILESEVDIEQWTETFRKDPTDWAILKLCTYRCDQVWFKDHMTATEISRLQAFACINAINFALSEPSRREWIHDIVTAILQQYPGREDDIVHSLCNLVLGNAFKPKRDQNEASLAELKLEDTIEEEESETIEDMANVWTTLLEIMFEIDSIFLRMALALSFSGVVFIPEGAYADFIDEHAPRFVVWPGRRASAMFIQDVEVTISTLPSGDFQLSDIRWMRARISLAKIAKGEGWYPLGVPLGVMPPETMRPTPLYDEDGHSKVYRHDPPSRPIPMLSDKQNVD